mgnify:CR=1 FL=1
MKNGDLKSLLPALERLAHQIKPYTGVMLFLLLACVYGYMVLRINTLSNAQADQNAVSSQVKSLPRIDAKSVQQLETLKDNSVNVQSLFNQGRSNPFGE